jgi:hypothetical protein
LAGSSMAATKDVAVTAPMPGIDMRRRQSGFWRAVAVYGLLPRGKGFVRVKHLVGRGHSPPRARPGVYGVWISARWLRALMNRRSAQRKSAVALVPIIAPRAHLRWAARALWRSGSKRVSSAICPSLAIISRCSCRLVEARGP